jgi:thioredoxin 1
VFRQPSVANVTTPFSPDAPAREDVDAMTGALVLQFGTDGCGHCRAAQAGIEAALAARPEVRHLKIEDGPRRPLGRSFGVKLWPTLVFLRDGREVARVVRPRSAQEVDPGLAALGR